MNERINHSLIDKFLMQCDQALRTCVPGTNQASRKTPAEALKEEDLSYSDKKHIAGLMRINHTGEVCAQALYAGQAMTAKLEATKESMKHAAEEEVDHLAWCDERLAQLNSKPSVLNPFYYGLSFAMGAAAGLAGDRWSLGFIAETERQVAEHLQNHLQEIPERDKKTRAILQQMIVDEEGHGEAANAAGGKKLPEPMQETMSMMAKVMKKTTYHV